MVPSSRALWWARKPRRSRKALPHKPAPACGPVVRLVRGKAVTKPVDAEAEERARAGLERLMVDPSRAARGRVGLCVVARLPIGSASHGTRCQFGLDLPDSALFAPCFGDFQQGQSSFEFLSFN